MALTKNRNKMRWKVRERVRSTWSMFLETDYIWEASEAFARELTQIFDERGGAMAAVPHPLVIKGLGHLIRSGQVAEAHRIVAGSDLRLEVHGTRETYFEEKSQAHAYHRQSPPPPSSLSPLLF